MDDLTKTNAVGLALKAAEAMGYGPVRRQWFALGVDLHLTEPNRRRALRPTERQHQWLDEGQAWAKDYQERLQQNIIQTKQVHTP
jgi:hypothetical protein